MTLFPQLEGEFPIDSNGETFFASLRERIVRGFPSGDTGVRQQYELVGTASDVRTLRATNWLTAINVGMNHLSLKLADNGKLQYRLTYWRWTGYCVGLGAILGMAMIALFLAVDMRQDIASNPQARIPGLTIDQNVYFAWGNIAFWGFVWPWILVALHKRPLRKLLLKTFSEIDRDVISYP